MAKITRIKASDGPRADDSDQDAVVRQRISIKDNRPASKSAAKAQNRHGQPHRDQPAAQHQDSVPPTSSSASAAPDREGSDHADSNHADHAGSDHADHADSDHAGSDHANSDHAASTDKAPDGKASTDKTPAEKTSKSAKSAKLSKSAKSPESPDSSDSPTSEHKPFILFRPFIALGHYLRDSWRELRQVHWPSRKATWQMLIAVILYAALFMVLITLFDLFFTWLFNLIFNK